jgi:hypothetical protein
MSIPLPILNRNGGPIALAEAERERARAELALARLETRTAIGRALRSRNLALERVRRDRVLVESAERIAAMSLTAYREGAQGLPAVLEAQRNAREILNQYIDDLAEASIHGDAQALRPRPATNETVSHSVPDAHPLACRKSETSRHAGAGTGEMATVAIAPFADVISAIGTVNARAGRIASLSACRSASEDRDRLRLPGPEGRPVRRWSRSSRRRSSPRRRARRQRSSR